ncbi:general transcription factor 3C polypeptide 5 [Anabrus simplex]|uniref:general transcription factor 3C polypeptide 5 n=1 Tax=Anabrus simplex TaxID=316456 RepID=UPI0035A33D64
MDHEEPSGFKKQFICVEYPGVVVNEENMLRTLGGIHNISTAYLEKNRRLELRFRPDDVYSKPACGERQKKTSLLIKIKVKRRKRPLEPEQQSTLHDSKDNACASTCDPSIISSEVIIMGRIDTIFRFENLCDFQYLPMSLESNNKGPMQCIYDTLMPSGIPPASWLSLKANLFLPPAVFSRMDSMQTYLYRKEANEDNPNIPPNIIGRTRRRRSGHAVFVTFDISKIPDKPRDVAIKFLHLKFLGELHLKKISKLFAQRPIWSKNALMYHTKYTTDQLKFLLPAVAYYFVTGPWRVMWVRFGYDPRKDPSARKYQTLDYRLRTSGGLKTKVKAKRSYCNYLLPYKSSPTCRPKTAIISKEHLQSKEAKGKESENLNENMYVFRPGMLPPSRQMFYQYCDVYVPAIQEMMIKLPPPAPDAVCHERNGWLPQGMDAQCREIINKLVTDVLRKEIVNR